MEKYMLPCLTKKFLGIDCLGCGIQRSLLLLFKGEFVQSFYMYPAIYPMLALGAVILLQKFSPMKYGVQIITILGILTGAVMIGSYILKHFI